jgi:hypothetical protein
MFSPQVPDAVIDAIRSGDEELDRGHRGPGLEMQLLAEAGLLIAPLSPDQGGQGWGTTSQGALPMLNLLTALGGASLPIARIYEGHVNALKLITDNASKHQYGQIANAVRGGAVLGVWGADASQPVAVFEEQEHPCLMGSKAFASGLGVVSLAIITAKCNAGTQMILAHTHDPSRAHHHYWDVASMVGSKSGLFVCDGLPAAACNLLGRPNAMLQEPAFHGGIWRLTACYAGALERISQLMAHNSLRRATASQCLMEQRLGQVILEAQTATLWARQACCAAEHADNDPNRAIATVLFAREAIENAVGRTLLIVERALGTSLHAKSSALGRLARDLRFYLRQADLDGKLSFATRLWLTDPSSTS